MAALKSRLAILEAYPVEGVPYTVAAEPETRVKHIPQGKLAA